LSLNVESDKFFLALSFLGFFFFFYSCTIAITWITTTITSSSVSEGEGTLETSYKLWSSEFQSFEGREEWVGPKLVLLPALGLTSTCTHTHTHKVWLQYKICTRWCKSHTFSFLVHGFWSKHMGLCTPMCFWIYNHVMSNPCSSSRRRRQ
jgi:hypothetical protein